MLAGMELLSVIARLSLAALFGGLLGLERERKNRPAGLRTYLIVCVGAALTVLLSEYEQWMLSTRWAAAAGSAVQIDISRLGAQVINGIGFLGAGTILVSSRKKVRGLTTIGLYGTCCGRGILYLCMGRLCADLSGYAPAAPAGGPYSFRGPQHECLCGLPVAGEYQRHHRHPAGAAGSGLRHGDVSG
jgi:hypothetical protein